MNKPERVVWKRLVHELNALGILAKIDLDSIARYCTLTVWWHECREFVEKYGKTYPVKAVTVNTTTGETREYVKGFRTHPQVGLALDYAAELRRLGQEFGLTPAARTRLAVATQPPPMVASRQRLQVS